MPTTFRYDDEKRKNLPAAGMAVKDSQIETDKLSYDYDPHLTPVLRYDESGEADELTEEVRGILDRARTEKLTPAEIGKLQDALLRSRQPWLEWSGKKEKQRFEVDPVALHIHEKVAARAILRAASRDDLEEDLFSRERLDRESEKQFYQHDVDWANRLILGDSLQVMTSLAKREGLAGQVQMVYIDPPYGIKFSSNWQNEVGKRDVKDKDADLTRDVEMIKAYRDTWTLGVHSYLDYLKQRLVAARELLKDSGSVFVQISDENLHRVRALMDDVFGAENFVANLIVRKTTSEGASKIGLTCDYIIWYAKSLPEMHYLPVFSTRSEDSESRYSSVDALGNNFRFDNITSSRSTGDGDVKSFEWFAKSFNPGKGTFKTTANGLSRIGRSERLLVSNKGKLNYKRNAQDFGFAPVANLWNDISGAVQSRSDPKVYVVQTSTSIVERCLLMTTEPGDLILDPTCGSGTSARTAEQWGRRWITIDSSRVAAAIARQRLLTAKFEAYKTHDETEGVEPIAPKNPGTGFVYKTVPHITLKSIAQNAHLDPIFEKHEPILTERLAELNEALGKVKAKTKATLVDKLEDFHKREGAREVTDAHQRRWLLPGCDPITIKKFTARAADKTAGFSKNITAKQVESYREFVEDLDPGGWKEWQVPFDTDPDWPQSLQDALTAYREAWRAKMDDVNECIENNAEHEVLVDQPEVVKGVTRVTGPFTVESVRPLEKSLKGEATDDAVTNESPIGGAPEEMESFDGDVMVAEPADLAEEAAEAADLQVKNAVGHLDRMLALLRQDGLTFPGNRHVSFGEALQPIESEFLHAEADYSTEGGETRSAGIVIGPEHGAVTAFQANSAIFQAIARGYDDLFFAAFSFDATAQDKIQEANDNDAVALRVHMAMIRPDVLMGDLLKGNTTAQKKAATEQSTQQLFTVFGQPRTSVEKVGDEWKVTMEGMDVYDPVRNEIVDTKAGKVSAWFLDTDYDGKTFCITQAFFPDKTAWTKLAKSLKENDESRFAETLGKMKGNVSLPFPAGRHKRVAVKVIDPRGNEVLRVHGLSS